METMQVRIVSGSMQPTLSPGDLVTVEQAPPEVGEVGAFLVANQIVIHRVVAKWHIPGGSYLVHRGDASSRTGLCKEHQVVGRVQGLEPIEPPSTEALNHWFMGRLALIGANLSRADMLRPLFRWAMGLRNDEQEQSLEPDADEHWRAVSEAMETVEEAESAPEVAPLSEFGYGLPANFREDGTWQQARFDLLRHAEAELEAAEAAEGGPRRSKPFPLGAADERRDEASRADHESEAEPCDHDPGGAK